MNSETCMLPIAFRLHGKQVSVLNLLLTPMVKLGNSFLTIFVHSLCTPPYTQYPHSTSYSTWRSPIARSKLQTDLNFEVSKLIYIMTWKNFYSFQWISKLFFFSQKSKRWQTKKGSVAMGQVNPDFICHWQCNFLWQGHFLRFQ